MKTGRAVTSRIGDCGLWIADCRRDDGFGFAEFFGAAQGFFFFVIGSSAAFFQFVQARNDFAILDFGLWTLFPNFFRPAGNRLAYDVADLRHLVNAHERVHFRHELGQFIAEPLRQAAGNDDGLAALVRIAQFDGFENRVHAFLLRRVNEGTGVDDDGVGLRGVIGDLDAALEQRAEHDFGVHQIFGAAERNQADAQRLGTGIFLRHRRISLRETALPVENYFTAAPAQRRWSGWNWWKQFPRRS